jgi:hypothetical protein
MNTTRDPRPVAVGYVSDLGRTDQTRQSDALLDHARAEGLRLARILPDLSGIWTISQLVKAAGKHGAAVVLLPAGVHLAEAHERISADLAALDARCVIVDDAPTDRSTDGRPVARLSAALRRREAVPTPA